MKNLIYISSIFLISFSSCTKNIDLMPQSNAYVTNYYSNYNEINVALTGCYNGMQNSLFNEWQMTELRSDNTVMGSPGSKSNENFLKSDLDMFIPSTSHPEIYNYWLATYNNIRNTNLVLNSLGVNYHESTGNCTYDSIAVSMTSSQRRSLASEASFIRAYHYFNLVRLFGGVFLIHEPISPDDAKLINRSSVADIYKLIIADLQNTVDSGYNVPYSAIPASSLGRTNSWAAKALLAKVYLTLNRKTEAATLLQDVITNSGYSLLPNYESIFSTNNEMNAEILFSVRYKAGGLNLGSPFPNQFAPLKSGAAIVNGDGNGWNYPSLEVFDSMAYLKLKSYIIKDSMFITLKSTLSTATPIAVGTRVLCAQVPLGTVVTKVVGKVIYISSANISSDISGNSYVTFYNDNRLDVNVGLYAPNGSSSLLLYPKKLVSNVYIVDDGENDWPVIRFSDVILMLAEAQGNTAASIGLINLTRARAGLTALSTTLTTAAFEKALSKERRFELAFENHRWFDLLRYNTTMTTITVEQTMKDHYQVMYPVFYKGYSAPTPSLATLQSYVIPDRMLLPIPQREIDNNTQIVIPQNPSY